MKQKNIYPCRKMKLCSYLLTMGFNFTSISVDFKNPSRVVWLFDRTQELLDCVDKYYSLPNDIQKCKN